MKKEDIRKEFFKLKNKGQTNNQCRKILLAQFGYEVNIRTLRRWTRRLENTEWDLIDKSTKPNKIHTKITSEIESEVIRIRNKTGWGEHKIVDYYSKFNLSHASVYKILRKHRLTKPNENRRKRIK